MLYSKNDFVIMDLSSTTREEVGAEQAGSVRTWKEGPEIQFKSAAER